MSSPTPPSDILVKSESFPAVSIPVEESDQKTPSRCDRWKFALGVSVTLLLVSVAIIIHLAQELDNKICTPEIAVKIPGADPKYSLIKLDKSFNEAHEICESYDGELASFSSLTEWREFATKLFQFASMEGWSKPMWLGARGNGKDSFRWLDKTPFIFNVTQHSGAIPWHNEENSKQPNNGFEEGICLYVYIGHGRTVDHSWHDYYGCETALWFVCTMPE